MDNPVSRTNLHFTPARRERLADILYGQILEQIAAGRLSEGEKLPSEAEISRAFDVSRPVVREALMRLQVDGLIYARRGSGRYVKRRPPPRLIDFAASADIASYLRSFEPRIGLETEAARHAAARRSREQLQTIEAWLLALEEAFARGASGLDDDFAFHMAIADATGNELFRSLLDGLREFVMGGMGIALNLTRIGSDERRRQVLTEHRQIYDAIASGDPDAAGLFMRYHLVQARNRTTDSHLHP